MYKDMIKMTFRISLLLLASMSLAFAEDSTLVERKKSFLETLDSMNAAVFGLRLNGTAKGGVVSSTMSSDQLMDDSDSRENQAFSDVNLVVTARPSTETEVRAELRLHKDWQSAYEESQNPIIGHWFSYDGKILNKHVDFNLGYMRVGYTPLTLYVPQTNVLQEPDIFLDKRIESLAMRNLDTSSNRLLQGLNVEYNSFKVGPLSNIYAQVTGARLRNIAKKNDQVFFDFDWSDRYMIGSNAGVQAYGFTVGGNIVYTFDREKTTEARKSVYDSIFFDKNRVFSGILGFDSKELIGGKVNFGLNAEVAKSNWEIASDVYTAYESKDYYIRAIGTPQYDEDGNIVVKEVVSPAGKTLATVYDTTFYVYDSTIVEYDWDRTNLDERKGLALNVTPFVKGKFGNLGFDVKGTFAKNDEEFWSEQAASNYFRGYTSVLNADALFSAEAPVSVVDYFRSGSLENLYFSIYSTNVLQQQNLMSKNEGAQQLNPKVGDSHYTYGRLYNNYKLGHFYRNGYSAAGYKLNEYAAAMEFIEPSINMAMPMGLATPDRMGFEVSGDVSWGSAAVLNLRFSKYNQDEIDNEYTTMGAGLSVDIGEFLGMNRRIKLQGSYEKAEETAYLKRESARLVAGATIDVWGPFTLMGGVQILNKEYGNAMLLGSDSVSTSSFEEMSTGTQDENGVDVTKKVSVKSDVSSSVTVNKVDEMLFLAGLQVRLGAGVTLDLQGGLMKNEVSYDVFTSTNKTWKSPVDDSDVVESASETVSGKMDINKMLLMANITVLF